MTGVRFMEDGRGTGGKGDSSRMRISILGRQLVVVCLLGAAISIARAQPARPTIAYPNPSESQNIKVNPTVFWSTYSRGGAFGSDIQRNFQVQIADTASFASSSVVYASDRSGNWDIYLQSVGGERAIKLTEGVEADDTQPAFSPDGEQIVFRSERDGGGLFLMGRTGESVRRVADFGYNPAWAPDGKRIVCATGVT